ncbi:MAG: ATP-binding protein [Candidatus Altiarchaeota archaeon]
MNREEYYTKLGWRKSPFIKSTSLEIPIINRVKEYEAVCECIGGWDRIMLITAPIGYGKTTFMNQLVMNKPRGVRYAIAFNAYEPVEEAMPRIKNELSLIKRLFYKADRTTFGEILQEKLGEEKMLLLFDEAQDYETDLFKWLRILNDRCNNLFMVFLGLQGLEDKITSEASFRDRKSKSIVLRPFEVEELEAIARERIRWAGGKGIKPFTEDGLRRLCESCDHVPRQLLENGQRVIEECAGRGFFSADANLVEDVLGGLSQKTVKKQVIEAPVEVMGGDNSVVGGGYGFMKDLSPTQQEIVTFLLERESMSISELSDRLKKDIRSIGSLIRKLRGLNPSEVDRKPGVPYPVIVRKGKEVRMGRLQYVYALSDNARRLSARK